MVLFHQTSIKQLLFRVPGIYVSPSFRKLVPNKGCVFFFAIFFVAGRCRTACQSRGSPLSEAEAHLRGEQQSCLALICTAQKP